RFAGAIGQKAKTDKLDAQLIAHFGEAIKPPLSSLKPEQMRLMSDLLSRRRQLMDMQTMEKNRSQIMPKTISSLIKPILTALKNQIEKVDLKLQKLIKECDEYKVKNDIIQSVPGVGNVVAFNLLSDMPELGCVNNKEAASLVGVAPFNRESGAYQGKRMIRGGRPKIRTAMYMAMMSAIQCNPKFKAIYHRLVAAGKPKKVAIIACIRKLIVIINSMVRDGVMWDPKMV
ncbi:IS110 family transposase, partial [Pseudoalteromonas sp. NSLLW218]